MRGTTFAMLLLLCQGVAADGLQIVLPFNDVALIPGHVVRLKAETLRLDPKFDFNKVELDSVDIVAKSRLGQGRIALRVGNQYSPRKLVPGKKQEYDDPADPTFHTVNIRHYGASSAGLWQLLVVGYIKLRQVVLHLRPRADDAVLLDDSIFASAPGRNGNDARGMR